MSAQMDCFIISKVGCSFFRYTWHTCSDSGSCHHRPPSVHRIKCCALYTTSFAEWWWLIDPLETRTGKMTLFLLNNVWSNKSFLVCTVCCCFVVFVVVIISIVVSMFSCCKKKISFDIIFQFFWKDGVEFFCFRKILRVSDQNGVFRLYIIVERYHSGRIPSDFMKSSWSWVALKSCIF